MSWSSEQEARERREDAAFEEWLKKNGGGREDPALLRAIFDAMDDEDKGLQEKPTLPGRKGHAGI